MDVDMDAAAEAAGTKPKADEDRGARCQKATGLKEEFQAEPEWPVVTCSSCNDMKELWKKMESTGPHYNETSGKFFWRYGCWKCVMKREDLPHEGAARMYISSNKSDFKNRKERNEHWKEAFVKVAEDFPMLTDRSQKVKVTRDTMAGLFESFGKYQILKGRQMQKRSEKFDEYEALIEATRALGDHGALLEAMGS